MIWPDSCLIMCTACTKYVQVVSLEKMLVAPRPLVTLILKWEQSCDRPIVFAAIFMVFSVVFWRRTFVFCKKEYLLKRLERANLCQSVANYLDNRWWSKKSFFSFTQRRAPQVMFYMNKKVRWCCCRWAQPPLCRALDVHSERSWVSVLGGGCAALGEPIVAQWAPSHQLLRFGLRPWSARLQQWLV